MQLNPDYLDKILVRHKNELKRLLEVTEAGFRDKEEQERRERVRKEKETALRTAADQLKEKQKIHQAQVLIRRQQQQQKRKEQSSEKELITKHRLDIAEMKRTQADRERKQFATMKTQREMEREMSRQAAIAKVQQEEQQRYEQKRANAGIKEQKVVQRKQQEMIAWQARRKREQELKHDFIATKARIIELQRQAKRQELLENLEKKRKKTEAIQREKARIRQRLTTQRQQAQRETAAFKKALEDSQRTGKIPDGLIKILQAKDEPSQGRQRESPRILARHGWREEDPVEEEHDVKFIRMLVEKELIREKQREIALQNASPSKRFHLMQRFGKDRLQSRNDLEKRLQSLRL